jgi:hypothetical protein
MDEPEDTFHSHGAFCLLFSEDAKENKHTLEEFTFTEEQAYKQRLTAHSVSCQSVAPSCTPQPKLTLWLSGPTSGPDPQG